MKKLAHKTYVQGANKFQIRPSITLDLFHSRADPHFQAIHEIYSKQRSSFQNSLVRSSSNSPDTLSKFCRKSKTSFERKSFTSKRSTRQNSNPLRNTQKCMFQLQRKKTPKTLTHWHRVSPKKQRHYLVKLRQNKKLQCQGLKFLVEACKKLRSSSEVNKTIKAEQDVVKKWTKYMEETNGILRSLEECDSRVIKKLYFIDRKSRTDILKEMRSIKKQGEPNQLQKLKNLRSSFNN